jgi:hypothetical protein
MSTAHDRFLALHRGPGFVMPNAWDAASALIYRREGFEALGTSSAAIAWALGVQDGAAGHGGPHGTRHDRTRTALSAAAALPRADPA